jgi:glycerol kinase
LSRRCVLALDLGTTGVRALALRDDGRILARAWRPLETQFPEPGRVEQDPAAWWARSVEVLREALATAALGAPEVAAIGVVSQRATAVAWDAATGRPLAPAIGWQDTRTGPRVQELAARGIAVGTMPSATKLEWLLTHEPALREAARSGRLRLGTPDAWLTDRLCGGAAFATDAGQASCTGLFDLRRSTWSEPALALFGIDAAWLPGLVPTAAVVGETSPSLLGASIPVAARAGDQQAASFAQGVLAPGQAKLTIGTSAMLDVHAGDTVPRPAPGTYPLALWELASTGRAYCIEGTVITAGAAVEWLVQIGLLADAGALDAIATDTPSSEGVVFVPALQGLGTPLLDTAARGACFGITRGTRAAHLVRAVLEGIAQRCADLEAAVTLAPGPLRVDGGLARCDAFVAALADATGRTVSRAAETETTALGAAYLAGLATGVWPDAGAAVATAATPTRIEPRIDAGEREKRRAEWRRAIERVRGSAEDRTLGA